jgi:hypothetical protein
MLLSGTRPRKTQFWSTKRKGNPKVGLVRTTYVSQLQESLTKAPHAAHERPTVVCRDCKSPSPVDSLIEVAALHVQCPVCLYVFFLDTERP